MKYSLEIEEYKTGHQAFKTEMLSDVYSLSNLKLLVKFYKSLCQKFNQCTLKIQMCPHLTQYNSIRVKSCLIFMFLISFSVVHWLKLS